MPILSFIPKAGTIIAVLMMMAFALAYAPATRAAADDLSAIGMDANSTSGCAQDMQDMTPCAEHGGCHHSSDGPCKDDINCVKICASACVGMAFLTPFLVKAAPTGRPVLERQHDDHTFSFQQTLNTPPPRS